MNISIFFIFCFSQSRHQEGKTIKSSSGFSGKGFKFDETEHALANERKKLQKAALGLQDSDDEDGALDVRCFSSTPRTKSSVLTVTIFYVSLDRGAN